MSWGSGAPLRPPTARGSHGPGTRRSTGAAGAAVAAEGGGGCRRARPFAGCGRGCATCGAELVPRARRGGDSWEQPRTRGSRSTPCPGRAWGQRDPQRSGCFAPLFTEDSPSTFARTPLPVCLGPARGSFRTPQTEDLATGAPGRCPRAASPSERCDRAQARALPSRHLLFQAGPDGTSSGCTPHHGAERGAWRHGGGSSGLLS